MYWYNPQTRTSERVDAPSTDEEAIQMLAGDPDSVTFVAEYAELRRSGMAVETALVLVGHEFRLRQHEHLIVRQPQHVRPARSVSRSSGYELLLALRLQEEGRDRLATNRSSLLRR